MGLDLGLIRFGKKSRWALSIINGNLTLGTAGGSTGYTNACLPAATFNGPTLCPFWDDLRTDGAGGGTWRHCTR